MATSRPKSWRDVLPIHAAADLFPMMSEAELRELGEDIKTNGLHTPIVLHEGQQLLDGRNRLDAMELVGIEFKLFRPSKGPFKKEITAIRTNDCDMSIRSVERVFGDDPYDYVISANAHRRHLTGEQKRELISKVLKAKPAASNRQIAKQVKADDKTVAKVRTELEATAEIPQLKKTTGKDGKARPSRISDRTARPKAISKPCQRGGDSLVPELNSLVWSDATRDQRRKFIDAVGPQALWEAASEPAKEWFRTAVKAELNSAPSKTERPQIPDDLSIPDFMRRVPG